MSKALVIPVKITLTALPLLIPDNHAFVILHEEVSQECFFVSS